MAAKKTTRKAKQRATRRAELGPEALERWSRTELDCAELAHQACALIRDFEARPDEYAEPDGFTSGFHRIVGLFHQPTDPVAKGVLRTEALPILLRLYDSLLDHWYQSRLEQDDDASSYDLLFALKTFALYQGKPTLQRIIAAARLPLAPEAHAWANILSNLVEHDPPAASNVASALRQPLPPGFLAVALLDMANTLARVHGLTPHPFDTPEGLARLQALLTDTNPDHYSSAHSAAASIPFLTDAPAFLALAEKHPALNVRMEAAWASAYLGQPRGLERLRAWARAPKTRSRAVAYLKEFGIRPPPLKPRAPAQPPRFVMSKRARA